MARFLPPNSLHYSRNARYIYIAHLEEPLSHSFIYIPAIPSTRMSNINPYCTYLCAHAQLIVYHPCTNTMCSKIITLRSDLFLIRPEIYIPLESIIRD